MRLRELVRENEEFPSSGRAQRPIKNGVVTIAYRVAQNPWPGKIRLTAYVGRKAVGGLVYGIAGQHIDDMSVEPQFQRQGINMAMHEYLEELLPQIDPSYQLNISPSLSYYGAKFYNVHHKMDAGKPWRIGRMTENNRDPLGVAVGQIWDGRQPEEEIYIPPNDPTPKNPALSPTKGSLDGHRDPMIQAPLNPIKEALDTQVGLSWRSLRGSPGTEAVFEVGGVPYVMSFMEGNWHGEPVTTLQYGLAHEGVSQVGAKSSTAQTGLGVPFRVMSGVVEAIKEFFTSKRPNLVFFYDGDRIGSRGRMYEKLAQFLTQYGYSLDEAETNRSRRTTGIKSVWLMRLDGAA
jgi:hypothetical protein